MAPSFAIEYRGDSTFTTFKNPFLKPFEARGSTHLRISSLFVQSAVSSHLKISIGRRSPRLQLSSDLHVGVVPFFQSIPNLIKQTASNAAKTERHQTVSNQTASNAAKAERHQTVSNQTASNSAKTERHQTVSNRATPKLKSFLSPSRTVLRPPPAPTHRD